MREIIQKFFFQILILIILVAIVALFNVVITDYNSAKAKLPDSWIVNASKDGTVVIVYFNVMPSSIDDFAYRYNVSPIFVKEDIKIGAFKTAIVEDFNDSTRSNRAMPLTQLLINNLIRDPIIESAQQSFYLFTDRNDPIATTMPVVTYPYELDRDNVDYFHNEVRVVFWRLPPDLEDYGSRYSGRLLVGGGGADNRTEISAVFKTDNPGSFIQKIANDPYVYSVSPLKKASPDRLTTSNTSAIDVTKIHNST